jgi:hypothetical protein
MYEKMPHSSSSHDTVSIRCTTSVSNGVRFLAACPLVLSSPAMSRRQARAAQERYGHLSWEILKSTVSDKKWIRAVNVVNSPNLTQASIQRSAEDLVKIVPSHVTSFDVDLDKGTLSFFGKHSDAILATGTGALVPYVGSLVGSRFTAPLELLMPFGSAAMNILHPFRHTRETTTKYLVDRQLKKSVLLRNYISRRSE